MLEGPDREAWQRPDQIMDALHIGEGSVVADLGAGGGWFTVRLARRVGPNGTCLRRRHPAADDSGDRGPRARRRSAQREDGARDAAGSTLPERRARCGAVRRHLSRDGTAGRAAPQRRHVAETYGPHRHRRLHEGRLGARARRWTSASTPSASSATPKPRACGSSGARPSFAISTCSCSACRVDDRTAGVLRGLPGSRRRRRLRSWSTGSGPVERAMAYTASAPSKQVRAVLTLLCAELCGGTAARAMPGRGGDRARARLLADPRRSAVDGRRAAAARAAGEPPGVRRSDRDPRGVRPARILPTARSREPTSPRSRRVSRP